MGKVVSLQVKYKSKKGNDILARLEREDPHMIESLERSLAIGWDHSCYLDAYCQKVRGVKSCRRSVKSGINSRTGKPYKESYLRELRRGTNGDIIMEAKPEIRMLAKLGFYKKPMGEGAIVLLARAQKLRKGIDRLGHFFEFLEKLADRFENINQRD